MKRSQYILKLLPSLLLAAAMATLSGQADAAVLKGDTNMVHKGGRLCVASELYPCLPSLTMRKPPSQECCQKLREQQPCFCEYLKNPVFRPYVHDYWTTRICITCGVQYPTTC